MEQKGDRMKKRIFISPMGEAYLDALTIEAWLKNRSVSMEAQSLLCAMLKKRQEYREKMVAELAEKRGIPPSELKAQILAGKAEILEPGDMGDD